MLTRPMFCSRIPVINIPIRAGRVVKENSHPPKCAAMVRAARPKSWPPGAASSPSIVYTMPQSNSPNKNKHNIRANFL
ncbi:hypothetical protein WN51_06535 [Melipona quadrifasciata]|uniref:Uncharacterized protein n=1 Tax=Melipona quadrifasciata TaxID=166423 RepID=A0A0M8ZUA9_9HYME|nr:hypothetical protein WN51_06535 [Melipona quadrifasciata]